MILSFVAALLVFLRESCDGAHILGMSFSTPRSHWIVIEPLFEELAARGHEVTVVSPFPQTRPNYTSYDLSKQLHPFVSNISIDQIKAALPNPWQTTHALHSFTHDSCKQVVEQTEFQNFIKKNNKYDLVIGEFFATDCIAYLAHKLNVPLILFTTSMAMPWGADRMGLPDNPSYIHSFLVKPTHTEITFWERLYNTLVLYHAKFWHQCVYSKETQSLLEETFDESFPPHHEVVANTSLMFVNSYHSLAQSRPFPPNVVEVGGIHIKKRQPLDKDLQDIMDNAKDGVIIMSFGSIVRSSTFPKAVIRSFMSALSKIPQTVIFKYEEDLSEAPPNVVVRKWISQRDLIEHENVVALIIHGGLASTIEAVHFNKPIVGIPIWSDQFVNVKAIVKRGAGVELHFDDITEENVLTAVVDVVNNPKYKENMNRLSQQFRDRPMTPLQSAVYWTEYVIRHQGAPHLRPASVGMPFYQYLLLDVVAVLLASLVVIVYVLFKCGKCILIILQGRRTPKLSSVKKSN